MTSCVERGTAIINLDFFPTYSDDVTDDEDEIRYYDQNDQDIVRILDSVSQNETNNLEPADLVQDANQVNQ